MQDKFRNISEVGEFVPFDSNNDITYESEYNTFYNNNNNNDYGFKSEVMGEGYYCEQNAVVNSMVNKSYNHISDVYNYGKTSIRGNIGMSNINNDINDLNGIQTNQNINKMDGKYDQRSKSKNKDIFKRLRNTNKKINYLLASEKYNSPISYVELDTPNDEYDKTIKNENNDYIIINDKIKGGKKISFDKGIEYVQLRYRIQAPELAESMMSSIVNRLNFIDGMIKLLKSQYEILEKISPRKEEINEVSNEQDNNNEKENEEISNNIEKDKDESQETFPVSDFLKNYSITLSYEHLRDTLESANKCLNDATKIKEKIEKKVNFSMSLMKKAKQSLKDNKQKAKKYADLSTKYKNRIMNIGKEILSVENKLTTDDTEPNDIGTEIARINNDIEMIRAIKEALIK